MDKEIREILRDVMHTFSELSYIEPDDVPDIPLYMDQITTFMETKLAACKRQDEDKILTKTMINNYTKNRLIPPPDKKKYSKDHLIMLIYVYYLKDFLSISDIKTLLDPLKESYFQSDDNLSMQEIYRHAFDLIRGQTDYMTKDLLSRWKSAHKAWPKNEAEDADTSYLELFSFVCLLSFDVYVKKKLIESAVDAIVSRDKSDRE